jgi:hypothetical protein
MSHSRSATRGAAYVRTRRGRLLRCRVAGDEHFLQVGKRDSRVSVIIMPHDRKGLTFGRITRIIGIGGRYPGFRSSQPLGDDFPGFVFLLHALADIGLIRRCAVGRDELEPLLVLIWY